MEMCINLLNSALRGIEMASPKLNDKILVVGLGVIGQFAVQICRLKGAQVCAVDLYPMRVEKAASLGADWVLNAAEDDLVKFVLQSTIVLKYKSLASKRG